MRAKHTLQKKGMGSHEKPRVQGLRECQFFVDTY